MYHIFVKYLLEFFTQQMCWPDFCEFLKYILDIRPLSDLMCYEYLYSVCDLSIFATMSFHNRCFSVDEV